MHTGVHIHFSHLKKSNKPCHKCIMLPLSSMEITKGNNMVYKI
uniref:Uncharacterized protein n=1 Tax=Anguilla anguilla TaxID=7936 RepID=A0A0E9TEQ0_ANGAN